MEVAREVDGVRVAIVAPAEVAVGEVATLHADVRGVDHWVWLLPDGGVAPDAARMRLPTRTALLHV